MAKILLAFLTLVFIQFTQSEPIHFRWCVKTAEKAKCEDFVKYVNETARKESLEVSTDCVVGERADDCAAKIKSNKADLVTLDGGTLFDTGKKYNLIPIVSEQYGKYGVKYYGVAVVKKQNKGFGLKSLKGKKSCHTGARRTAGWRVPIGYMLRTELLPAIDCGNENNDFISVAAFFKESCVPGVKRYNTSKNITSKLCALCLGTGYDQCSGDSSKNEYAGYHGSFKCMAKGGGDVAFVKHTTVEEVVAQGGYDTISDYQYLCKDGSRKDIGQHETCNLGFNPAHAVVTRKDNPDVDKIITILTRMSDKYGINQTNTRQFQLFNSSKYMTSGSRGNLIFKDSTTALHAIPEGKRTYQGFLGDDYVKDAEALKSCDFEDSTAKDDTSTASTAKDDISTANIPYAMSVVPFTALLILISI